MTTTSHTTHSQHFPSPNPDSPISLVLGAILKPPSGEANQGGVQTILDEGCLLQAGRRDPEVMKGKRRPTSQVGT